MKKLIRLTVTTIFSLLVFAPVMVGATTNDWQVSISSPYSNNSNIANSRKFNLTVSAISKNSNDILTVDVYDGASQLGSTLTGDTITSYGYSWTVPVNLSSDGTHNFKAVAHNSNGDPDQVKSVSVKVDTSAPAALIYKGSVRSGNKYTLTFTMPADGETATVNIYSSTKPSFTADSSTLVGTITINPGQTKTFSYTAPDSAQRYNAVQSVDSAGNTSGFTGDPNTSVSSSASTTNSNTSGNAGAGQVQGSETGNSDKKSADDKTNNKTSSDKKDDNKSSDNTVTWIILILVIAGLAGAYIRYLRGEDDNSFWPKKTGTSTKKKK